MSAIEFSSQNLDQYVSEKRVDAELTMELRQLANLDLGRILNFLQILSPSANTLRGFLRLATEVAQRDAQSVLEVLFSPAVENELNREGNSRKEKQKAVRQVLEARRYPERVEISARIERAVDAVRRDLNLKLSLPPDLEGDSLTLELSARDAQDFQLLGERVQGLARHPEVQQIFAILRGQW